jgi:hypothetical protein
VKAILENPRYTGYAIYGRWQKVEELLDPDDVAAGHVVRFRRSAQSRIVRSREPAHPAIVSVEDFTRVQLEMRARRGSGASDSAKRARTKVLPKDIYLLRGAIRCSRCGRRMEGARRSHAVFYRCPARTLEPGVRRTLEHPPTIYVREDHLTGRINEWISGLFSPENLDDTVAALADASDEDPTAGAAVALKRRIAAAQSAMDRLQRALEAGWDPEALTGQYNAAVAERRAAEAAFAALEPSDRLTAEEIRGVVAELGDMTEVLDRANRRDLAELYRALSLSISYDHEERGAVVSISPAMRVVKVGVRGGTCTLTSQFQRAS